MFYIKNSVKLLEFVLGDLCLMLKDCCNIYFDKPIKRWDDGLQLGNGDLGCLIWNKPNKLRFSIDKGGIWDCSNPPENQENFTYDDIINLVEKKDHKTLVKKYDDIYFNCTPTKLPTGKIIFDLKTKDNLKSKLDLSIAEAELTTSNLKLNSYIHASKKFGMIKIDTINDINIKIENPKYGRKKRFFQNFFKGNTTQSLQNLIYEKPQFNDKVSDDGLIKFKYFVQPINKGYYGIIVAIKKINASYEIAYTADIGNNTEWIDSSIKLLEDALTIGYDKEIISHKQWWREYWNKSSINLPDKFIERNWYIGNYLLASCSRKGCYPMPLQGVWTADNNQLPPWKGDYHHDLNTQMSYTSYLKANHLEEGECFIDYLFAMSESAKKFAQKFYNAKGLCLPSVMDIEGHALGGWCMYALSCTNQLWLCQIIARYYHYTLDIDYLKNKAYPYCCEVGEFILSMLKDENGFYRLPLSSSPEIHDNKLSSWLTPNSNYDLSLMHAFFNEMIILSDILGFYDKANDWRLHVTKLEPLAVDKDNILLICKDESLNESHRHHSHAMSIYPLRLLHYDIEEDRKIIDSTIQNLEELGSDNWVGYSFAWMAALYAIQKNGDKALEKLTTFFRYFCTDNGFHANGDYKKHGDSKINCRLITLEGNFLAIDALQEMLLYSENGEIELFPAIPPNWKDIEFKSFRACGGLLISASLKGGKLSTISIQATKDYEFIIKNDLTKLQAKDINIKGNKILIKENQEINLKFS